MYVVNSPTPIIMVSQYAWYAVHNGVWFTASAVQGPWVVATSVPPVIYAIPPSSPLSYVTYVQIYDVTPQSVVVGYTPGYMGTVVPLTAWWCTGRVTLTRHTLGRRSGTGARHLWICRQSHLDALDRLGHGLWFWLGHGRHGH